MIPNLLSLNFLMPFVAHKFDASNAIRNLRGMPRCVLLIGQAKPPATLNLNRRHRISTESDAIGTLGEGSMLLAMWRGARANAALGMPIDVIILPDDDTAVAATGKVTLLLDAAHASGELPLYIGGERVRVGVAVNDTVQSLTTKLINAINAAVKLPVTATEGTPDGEIVLTCKWGGATGNDIDLRTVFAQDDLLPQGLSVTVTPMAGGAVNPDITPAIVAMKGYRATEIAMPYTDSTNIGMLELEMEARWGYDNMQDGQVVTVMRGTEGQVTTWLTPRNSLLFHTICVTADRSSPWETAAMAAAAIESHCAIDPAVPFTGVQLVGYKAAAKEDDFEDMTQKNNLLNAGGSVLEVADDGTANLLRMVTNYTKHPSGAVDPSWRNLNWVKTLSYYRWFTVTEMQIRYRGFKLDEYQIEPIPGQKIMTVDLMNDIMLNNYQQFIDAGLFTNMAYYKDTLMIEVDAPNGKVKVVDSPVLITQHYQTEITSQFAAGHV
ncbi:phage tail sheath subtilisin-like domain-containing protein [Collimonas antrihumi]|uniref:phage tail sheath subtilisin-like domain-containing protein n=1 Tax=Collimonas antrihumi TaxID=1940615 RepID=UPI001B8D4827|nr:phage tail sheath subtilisin-like domain-containing protein [Collimonas antrihumi]